MTTIVVFNYLQVTQKYTVTFGSQRLQKIHKKEWDSGLWGQPAESGSQIRAVR